MLQLFQKKAFRSKGVSIDQLPVVQHGTSQEVSIWLYMLVSVILLTLVQLGCVYAVNDGFALTSTGGNVIGYSIFIACLVVGFWSISRVNRIGVWLILGIYVYWIAWGCLAVDEVTPIQYLLNRVMPYYMEYFWLSWDKGMSDVLSGGMLQQLQDGIGVTLLWVWLPFTMLTGYALVRKFRMIYAVLGSALAFVSVLPAGLVPSKRAIIFLCISAFLMWYLGLQKKHVSAKKKYENSLVQLPGSLDGFWLLGALICLSFVLCTAWVQKPLQRVVYPVQEYLYTGVARDFWRDLKMTLGGTPIDRTNSGMSGGELSGSDCRNETTSVDLVVTVSTPTSGYIYLKGYVGEIYDKRAWSSLPEVNRPQAVQDNPYQYLSPEYFLVSHAFSKWNTINRLPIDLPDIKNIRIGISYPSHMGAYVFFPYQSLISESDGTIENGSYMVGEVPRKEMGYFDAYYLDADALLASYDKIRGKFETAIYNIAGISQTERAAAEAYRQFVYRHYLQVPNRDNRLFEEMQGDARVDGWESYVESVQYVRAFLEEHATYSLSPGRTPYGKDFVDIFLYESHKGYCMHFATAATLMFRYMGIPARYVEGYLCPPQDGQGVVDIENNQAHAWAEIYVDGWGWVPIEVTPGYTAGTVLPERPIPEQTSSASTEETESTQEGSDSTEETETSTAEETGSETASETETETEQEATSSGEETEHSTEESGEGSGEASSSQGEEGSSEPSMEVSGEGMTASGDIGEEEEKGIAWGELWKEIKPIAAPVGITLGVLLVIYIVFMGRRSIMIGNRRRHFIHPNYRKAICDVYQELVCLTAIDDFVFHYETTAEAFLEQYPRADEAWSENVAVMLQTILQALFGKKELTKDDVRSVTRVYRSVLREIQKRSGRGKRFLLKWYWCY